MLPIALFAHPTGSQVSRASESALAFAVVLRKRVFGALPADHRCIELEEGPTIQAHARTPFLVRAPRADDDGSGEKFFSCVFEEEDLVFRE